MLFKTAAVGKENMRVFFFFFFFPPPFLFFFLLSSSSSLFFFSFQNCQFGNDKFFFSVFLGATLVKEKTFGEGGGTVVVEGRGEGGWGGGEKRKRQKR